MVGNAYYNNNSFNLKKQQANAAIEIDGSTIYAIDSYGKTITSAPAGINDDAVINYAIKSMGARGMLFVGKGTMILSQPIVNQNSIRIQGVGQNATIFRQTNGRNVANLIQVDGACNTLLSDFQVDGNKVNNPYNTNGIQFCGNNSRSRIERVSVYRCAADGINIQGIVTNDTSRSITIKDCHVEDVNGSGIATALRAGQISKIKIIDNEVIKTGNHGILASGASHIKIRGNAVINAGSNYVNGFAHGIAVDGNSGSNPSTGVSIIDNYIDTTRMGGIEVADATQKILVALNEVYRAGCYGIYYGGGLAASQFARIIGNYIESSGCASGCASSGIEINSPSFTTPIKYVIVKGNVCYLNQMHGIYFNHAQFVTCTDNITVNNNQSMGDNDGIRIGSVNDIIVKSNIGYDDQTTHTQNYAIAVYSGDDVISNILIQGNNTRTCRFGAISLGKTGVGSTIYVRDNIGFNPQPPTNIEVGPSPFTYKNDDFYPEDIIINDGLIQDISWSRDGIAFYTIQSQTGVRVRLEPFESIRISYTTLPTLTKIPL